MAIKPNAKVCSISEQIIEDLVTGITLQFVKYENHRGEDQVKLTLYGDFPFGNREIIFDKDGKECASGTATNGPCRPSWLQEVKA